MTSFSFSFDSATFRIEAFGKSYDGRGLLRNLEADLRQSTRMPQITARFLEDSLLGIGITVDYSAPSGYVVSYRPFTIMHPDQDEESRKRAAKWIKDHAAANRIKPSLPPLPGTVVGVEKEMKLNTDIERYTSFAHDGGDVIAFYQNKRNGRYGMLRQVAEVGVVRVEFPNRDAMSAFEAAIWQDSSDHFRADESTSILDAQLREFIKKNDLWYRS